MHPKARSRKSFPALALHPVLGPHHAWELRPKRSPPHVRRRDPNSSANPFLAVRAVLEPPNVLEPEYPNAKGGPHVPVHPHEPQSLAHPLDPEETPSNWLVSQSDAMALQGVAVQERQHDPAHPLGRACLVACVNPWHPASSCSSKSPLVVRQPQHPGVRMLPIAPRKPPAQLLLQWRGPQRPQRPVAQDSGPVPQEGNGAQGAPIGTTVPSSRHYAVARLKNNGKKSTSLARTTMLSLHKPADLLGNSRQLCFQPAWRAQPNRKPNNERLPSLWQRCANAARKPLVNGNVVAPWNCGQRARPSRYVPR